MPDKLIRCRQLLTPEGWKTDHVLQVGDDGIIKSATAREQDRDTPIDVELSGAVVPAMPNLHSHAFQRAMAGLGGTAGPGDDSFWTWREAMYRLANRITADQFQAIAAWLQSEMLKGGYTSCGEFHYLHHQPGGQPYDDPSEMAGRLLAAASESGINLTLLPVLYCRAGFGAEDVSEEQRRFASSVDAYVDLYERCEQLISRNPSHQLGVAPHSLRAVSGEQLERLLDALKSRAPVVHMHVAEQPAEVRDCERHTGCRPLRYLLEHHDLDERWCLVHATHLDDSEVRDGARTGAAAGLCPTTEADLGDGLFRLADWLDAGGVFGVGSDSNLRVSAAEELRLLENGSRLASQRRNVLSRDGLSCGRYAWQQAALTGARALAQPVGALGPGHRADLVELDSSHPLFTGLSGDELLNAWVFAGGRQSIKSVWVAGACWVDAGHHRNETALRRAFSEAMETLRA